MLAAEIHGKVSDSNPPNQRMEDTLTSSVFSVFRYLNNCELLSKYLSKACNIHNKYLEFAEIDRAWIYFWPLFKFQGTGFRQPDALLFLQTKHGEKLAIVVEAKYEYGLSNILSKGSTNTEDNIVKKDADISFGHQLMDEYCGLKCGIWLFTESYLDFDPQKELFETNQKYLLYVTANYEIPANDILEGLKTSPRFKHCVYTNENCSYSAEEEVYWVSWRDLWMIIDEIGFTKNNACIKYSVGERNLIRDLSQFLEVRELQPFNPFEKLAPLQIYQSRFDDLSIFQGLKPIDRYKETL